jgi:predicted  nucleic acid-binding Zn-ribbon protein
VAKAEKQATAASSDPLEKENRRLQQQAQALTEAYQKNMLEAQDLDNQVVTLERQIREAEKHNSVLNEKLSVAQMQFAKAVI